MVKQLKKLGRQFVAAGYGIAAAVLVAAATPLAYGADVSAVGHGYTPGTVVSSRVMTLSSALSQVATGKRITYRSTSPQGAPIVVSGAVLTPKIRTAPFGQRNIVAWGHGTAGMADLCAPSGQPNLYPDPAYPNYADTLVSYLNAGWTVTATDYPGLGTPGEHPYLVGDSEARAVIDSVRAARRLDISLSNRWVVSGHSQGGQAALFAGEIADTYGGGLNLKGVVAIAPLSNADIIASAIPGTPGQGYLVMALYGLAAVDPTVQPEQILAQTALSRVGALQTGCYNEVMGAFYDLTPEQLLVGGVLPEAITAKFAQYANPAQQAGTAPILLVQGDADQTIPLELTQLLQSQVCSYGSTPTQLNVYSGQDHDPVLYASMADTVSYISARFANLPAPSNCL